MFCAAMSAKCISNKTKFTLCFNTNQPLLICFEIQFKWILTIIITADDLQFPHLPYSKIIDTQKPCFNYHLMFALNKFQCYWAESAMMRQLTNIIWSLLISNFYLNSLVCDCTGCRKK